jgi:hypothetical protein
MQRFLKFSSLLVSVAGALALLMGLLMPENRFIAVGGGLLAGGLWLSYLANKGVAGPKPWTDRVRLLSANALGVLFGVFGAGLLGGAVLATLFSSNEDVYNYLGYGVASLLVSYLIGKYAAK